MEFGDILSSFALRHPEADVARNHEELGIDLSPRY
jgi:hypothetical protein